MRLVERLSTLQRIRGRRLILLSVVLCTFFAHGQSRFEIANALVPDSIADKLVERTLTPVEGVWQVVADDGAVFAIYIDESDDYIVTSLSTPDLQILPGEVVGTVKRSDGRGVKYEMTIEYGAENRFGRKRKYNVAIEDAPSGESDGGMLVIEPQRSKLKIEPWLYFRFFISVRTTDDKTPRQLRARRIFPQPEFTADYPLVL